MAKTFRGGVHVEEHKNTERMRTVRMPAPHTVSIPLSQHIGAPVQPLVAVGDRVLRGQCIGDLAEGLCAPVHSSVSGTVKAIEMKPSARGIPVQHIVIENDGEDELCPSIAPKERSLAETAPEQIVKIVRDAGVAGMGGATFPTHAKIASAIGRVNTIIVNGAECEPYITANHRLMQEHPEAVVGGARVLMHALGLSKAILAVEDNKPSVIQIFKGLTWDMDDISVAALKTKYPQGDERQLIYALTGKELPVGKLPADVGCVIFNAETVSSIYRAFNTDQPVIERIVTVDGDCVRTPQNLSVPIGTSYRDVIEFCGGLVKTPRRLISGGPMMGAAQWDVDGVVTKGTSAILLFSEEQSYSYEHGSCIHCGRCVKGCPMHLMPNYIAAYARRRDYESAELYGAKGCVECGSCSYVCPAHVPIVQYVRVAKTALAAKQKE
ncbi:MAG: electron transport complex subunit RsxC [Clostridia bacterium]|nr:electron transport complex subunit RsxC [Clostridia bacterium]